MINIDFLTLKAFFLENIDFIIGARVQKVQQPTRRDFVFSLRNNGESKKLYINIDPNVYHIAFMSKENEEKRFIEIPKQPPMFCMLLRKYLEGCKINDALVLDSERIIEFHFEICDEFSQKRSLALCVELMGKHSNVILYDRETSIIIGCAHNVGSEKSRYRELQGGLKYIRPPKSNGLSNELKEQFKNLTEEKIKEYLSTETFRPALKEDKYTLFSELLDGSIPQNSVSETIDNYYSNIQKELILKNQKSNLSGIVTGKLKKTNSSIDSIEKLLKKRDKTDNYRLYGELLTANLYIKADFQEKVELFDYVSNQNITIELEKTKTMNENAQRYFKLYTKSKTTKEKSAEILNNLKIEKEYYENILYSIKSADSVNDLQEIKSELGLVEEKKSEKPKESSILKLEINGFEVFIGRSNKQNDLIISKLSKDEDYWFHTRLCAGSHVLLKVRESEPDEETLFECCKLAREYSSASQPSKVRVIYTKRKFIKKPPAAPLGYVIYKNEKEVLV